MRLDKWLKVSRLIKRRTVSPMRLQPHGGPRMIEHARDE